MMERVWLLEEIISLFKVYSNKENTGVAICEAANLMVHMYAAKLLSPGIRAMDAVLRLDLKAAAPYVLIESSSDWKTG
jgi:hypothetical protein